MNTMTLPIRLGIMGSGGGSALAAASECLIAAGKMIEWVVITDRECGLEAWAKAGGHAAHRLHYHDAKSFSIDANVIFHAADCNDVLLFYTRRVAPPLIEQRRVWNIHPSLLPAFRGLHAVRNAMLAGVRIIGATLHRVDDNLDTGQIIAQVAAPLSSQLSLADVEHISYLQKVWLTLVWFDQLIACNDQTMTACYAPGVVVASPGIADDRLRVSYAEWLERSGVVAQS